MRYDICNCPRTLRKNNGEIGWQVHDDRFPQCPECSRDWPMHADIPTHTDAGAVERAAEMAMDELRNIIKVDPTNFAGDIGEFKAWSQNRARHTLAKCEAALRGKEGK
jgi:hypothetical protein